MDVEWATIGVMVALGGLLWRQIAALDTRLSGQMRELTADVGRVSERLARLEGWIERGDGRPALAGVQTREAE